MLIALAGIGKVAIDQHIPTIRRSNDWELAAVYDASATVDGVAAYNNFRELLLSRPDIEVVSLCLPPRPRLEFALLALEHNRHVMIEKPPGATLSECAALKAIATEKELAIFASWHSREAVMVSAAKEWLTQHKLLEMNIQWRENFSYWHPGQDWVWDTGGFGVFDPGINALSIVTEIIPDGIFLTEAHLQIPRGSNTPIAAEMLFNSYSGADVSASFDWREKRHQQWSIVAKTEGGRMELLDGGSRLILDGVETVRPNLFVTGEYSQLYSRFCEIVKSQQVDIDMAPLQLVADAFMIGDRTEVPEIIGKSLVTVS